MPPVILRSYRHVAAPDWRRSFHTVLRAGHVRASADYVVRRDHYPGQDVLFCVAGSGWVESLGKRHRVMENQLTWLANERPHAHQADPVHPWEFLWLRLDGPGLTGLRSLLFAGGLPVVPVDDGGKIANWFARLFRLLDRATPRIDLRLHELAAELFCLLGNSVNGNASREAWISFPDPLLKVVQAIRLHPEEPWSAAKMARMAGVSPARLRKLCAHFLHTSPQQWLIRERLAFAQNLLAENSNTVGEIAERCGYGDIYHFSREFKRHTGLSPMAFRRNERTEPPR